MAQSELHALLDAALALMTDVAAATAAASSSALVTLPFAVQLVTLANAGVADVDAWLLLCAGEQGEQVRALCVRLPAGAGATGASPLCNPAIT